MLITNEKTNKQRIIENTKKTISDLELEQTRANATERVTINRKIEELKEFLEKARGDIHVLEDGSLKDKKFHEITINKIFLPFFIVGKDKRTIIDMNRAAKAFYEIKESDDIHNYSVQDLFAKDEKYYLKNRPKEGAKLYAAHLKKYNAFVNSTMPENSTWSFPASFFKAFYDEDIEFVFPLRGWDRISSLIVEPEEKNKETVWFVTVLTVPFHKGIYYKKQFIKHLLSKDIEDVMHEDSDNKGFFYNLLKKIRIINNLL